MYLTCQPQSHCDINVGNGTILNCQIHCNQYQSIGGEHLYDSVSLTHNLVKIVMTGRGHCKMTISC